MSKKYDEYLTEHKANVWKAFEWMREYIPDVVAETPGVDWEHLIKLSHDYSKSSEEEYEAYDNYFYGDKSYGCVRKFKYAWLHHIHKNPHHWQHWVLANDDPEEGTVALEMPYEYIVEMICDWWSFSWKSGNLYELFDWYESHKENMVLEYRTKAKVLIILSKIKDVLDRQEGE